MRVFPSPIAINPRTLFEELTRSKFQIVSVIFSGLGNGDNVSYWGQPRGDHLDHYFDRG